jgi:hypothetical protein
MYVFARPKQEQVIALLIECCSIRAIERITGVHRDTVMRLGLRAGRHAYLAMDRELRDIQAERIECEELWTYVATKDKRLTVEDKLNDEIGSQFVFNRHGPGNQAGAELRGGQAEHRHRARLHV